MRFAGFLLVFCWGFAEFLLHVCWVFAVFLLCFDSYAAQHNASFAAARTFHKQTFLHKHCFYTSPAFKQALLLHKSVFTQDLLLHKPCFYTSAVFTQALLLHKACFYTNAVFTQALSLHKHCLYTRPAFTQKRFYTRPPFTQTLSLHKLCLYTSIAFIQALLLHNDIVLTKAFCNLQTGNRLEGRRNAEGCKYLITVLENVAPMVTSDHAQMNGLCTLATSSSLAKIYPIWWRFTNLEHEQQDIFKQTAQKTAWCPTSYPWPMFIHVSYYCPRLVKTYTDDAPLLRTATSSCITEVVSKA